MRGIADGDAVRVFNGRGACYLGACLSDGIQTGVIRIETDAWFDPQEPRAPTVCYNGNPTMLTLDKGNSRPTRGPIANPCLIEIGTAGDAPPVSARELPEIIRRRP